MTAPVLHFWYDFSSPFTYLASTQVEAVAARTGARLVWRPMLLGALFKQIGTPDAPILAAPRPKQQYYLRDLALWAAHWGVPFRFTSRFPLRTVTALRLALLAGDRIAPLSHALFRAAWVEDRDVADEATLGGILESLGLDARDLLARTQEPATKQRLVDATAEAVSKGVFGAPTFIVEREGRPSQLLWGQDRLALVERFLGGWEPEL